MVFLCVVVLLFDYVYPFINKIISFQTSNVIFAFIMMLFVFYSSKDYLLLSFLLLRISSLDSTKELIRS